MNGTLILSFAFSEAEPVSFFRDDSERETLSCFAVDGEVTCRIFQNSREPFGPWIVLENLTIICSSVPKGAVWKNQIVFAGFGGKGRYAGTMTFRTAENCEDGFLIFKSCPKMFIQ